MLKVNAHYSLLNQCCISFQVSRTHGVFKHDMVCPASDSSGFVLFVGDPGAVGARRSGCHDNPHPGQRAHRQPRQDAADQTDEVQRREGQTYE